MNKLIIFLLFIIKTSLVQAIETPAKQGILYDFETKSVLFEKNSDELMSPSSMSKIMTIYYLFKKIKDGEISIDDEFEVSKKAWKKGGSKMFVNLKSMVRVEDLIRGIIVQSGNDATVALAEHIGGSEDFFVSMMNSWVKKIGLKKLPAYVKDVSDETAALHALIENVQREDLNPIDEAMALNNIAEKFKLTHEKLSSITGKSRAHVTNTIRLLQLDEKIKKLVKNGAIEMGHARVLITLEKSNQINLANEIISKGLSVRQAEKLVSLKKPIKKSKKTRKPDHISSLEGELSALIGAKVEIIFDNKIPASPIINLPGSKITFKLVFFKKLLIWDE